jgi:hypothetical protein
MYLFSFFRNRRKLTFASKKTYCLFFKNVKIVYYVMRSKNEVLCAAAGRLAAERSEADKPAKAHKTIFTPNNIYYFFFKPS